MTASKKQPNLGLTAGWETGEDFWGGPMNSNLVALDTLVYLVFDAAASNAPPAGTADGERFLVGPNPVGVWAGQPGKVAVLVDGSWAFATPKTGWRALFKHLGRFYWYNGTTWVDEVTGFDPENPTPPAEGPQYWEMGVTIRDQILDNEPVVHLPITTPIFLPANMLGSSLDMISSIGVNATLRVFRNNTLIGTILVEAGQFNAVFSTVSGLPVTFGIGDRLTIRGQTPSVPEFKYFGLALRFNVVG